jgi:FlaG/FlaF family flagellin (archaellin)
MGEFLRRIAETAKVLLGSSTQESAQLPARNVHAGRAHAGEGPQGIVREHAATVCLAVSSNIMIE